MTSFIPRLLSYASLGLAVLSLSACSSVSEADAPKATSRVISVDIATASFSQEGNGVEYIGTTEPVKVVNVQAQTQGKLLQINYDIGDRVPAGAMIAKLDGDILAANVDGARAQTEAQLSEVASAKRRVGEMKTRAQQAQVELTQAENRVVQLENSWKSRIENAKLDADQTAKDAARQARLFESGITSQQEAEQAETLAQRAKQTLLNEQANAQQELEQAVGEIESRRQLLKAAQAQVAVEKTVVEAADKRVKAQQSILAQANKEKSLSSITSPFDGVVMDKQTEAGTFLQTGQDIITLGDFSQVKVVSQISEKQLGNLAIGQTVQVKLDAFPDQTFIGSIHRISPQADSISRLIPVKILMPNPQGKIGAGLLARVSLEGGSTQQITVPESALQKELPTESAPGSGEPRRGFVAQRQQQNVFEPGDKAYVFVISGGDSPTVRAREVVLGDRVDGQVEIRSGLSPNERYVERSSQPLKDGITVNISALSQSQES